MRKRRFALVFVTLPLAFYVYACSDSTENPGGSTNPDASSDVQTNPSDTGTDGNNPTDGSVDSGTDADSGPLATCVGNPLTADGGTPDGGVDAGLTNQIASGTFLDGPVYVDLNGGMLVLSEVFGRRVATVAPDGGALQTLRQLSNNPTDPIPIGNAIGKSDGGNDLVFTAQAPGQVTQAQRAVIRTKLDDGGVQTTTTLPSPVSSPNDLVVSKKGETYFTDPAYQAFPTTSVQTGVYRLLGDGGVEPIQTFAAGVSDRANGIALSPDESTLYVSFTDAKRITKYTVNANGSVTTPVVTTMTFIDSPDGIAVDVGGNIWVAEANVNGATNSGRVEVFAPDGTKWGEIPFPNNRPTGVAFGGSDNKTLYVTTEKGNTTSGLFVFRSRCVGLR